MHIFSISQFTEKLKGHSSEEIPKAHETIVTAVLNGINGLLFFGGNELARIGNQYVIKTSRKCSTYISTKDQDNR